jgi:hypothetical protein
MIRLRKKGQPIFILMILLTLSISIPFRPALAALIDTQTFISEQGPDQVRARFMNLLAREDVRVALLQYGINATEVEAQIDALTDQEILQVSETIDALPASGDDMAPAFPIWLVLLILLVYVLVITGVISLGAYASGKVKESQEEEYAKSTPFPAPSRVGPLPSVNPYEPWTGKWKVTEGQYRGVYCLKQEGDRVVSTSDSDQVVDAKVYGAMIWWKTGIGARGRDIKATIADDFLSFRANVDGGSAFEALKTELESEPTALKVNTSEPWTGKWKVSQGRIPGIWSLTQKGDTVISTADSDFKLEAKIYGAMVRGKWSTKGGTDRDFQATIAEDGLSFNGAANYTETMKNYFTAKKIE